MRHVAVRWMAAIVVAVGGVVTVVYARRFWRDLRAGMAVAEPRSSAPCGAPLPARDMAWNLQPLRFMRTAMTRMPEAAPAPPIALSWSARRRLLAIFRRHAAVLQLTVELARVNAKLEQHATLGARLAVLRARVEAGETSRSLLSALTEFGIEFNSLITWELGYHGA